MQVFVLKRWDAQDGKNKSAGFLSQVFSLDVLLLGSDEGVVVEISHSMIVVEFGFPEHLGEVFKVVRQDLWPIKIVKLILRKLFYLTAALLFIMML